MSTPEPRLGIAINLDQLSVLMSEYLNTFDDDSVMRALVLSSFLAWLRQRPTNLIKGEFQNGKETTERRRADYQLVERAD